MLSRLTLKTSWPAGVRLSLPLKVNDADVLLVKVAGCCVMETVGGVVSTVQV